MRTTDNQGRPIRYVPRKDIPPYTGAVAPPSAPSTAGPGQTLVYQPNPERLTMPAIAGPRPLPPMPVLPPPATSLKTALLLLNALREALLAVGWAREE